MNLDLTRDDIREAVLSSDLISRKEFTGYPGLYLLKYKKKVFFKNLWDEILVECRGTVVDHDYYVVSRPFTKVFNYGENGTTIDHDTFVTAPRKINGFMAALTWYNDQPLVSTTGSLESGFVELARSVLSQTRAFDVAREHGNHKTWIFEICDPSDPHIVPEDHGAWLLGCRENLWSTYQHYYDEYSLDEIGRDMMVNRPEWYRMKFGDVLKMNQTAQHEGFMCWDDAGNELKLKSPYYLTNKFLARLRGEKLMDFVMKNPEQLKTRIDEEFYPLIDHVVDNAEYFAGLDEQSRLKHMRAYLAYQVGGHWEP